MVVDGRILVFKAHTDDFCKKTMKSTIDVQQKVIQSLKDDIERFSLTHVCRPPSRAAMLNDYDPFDPDD